MQIVHRDGDDRRELDVRVNTPAATVADLAAALDPARRRRPLAVGGRVADPDLDLIEAGLHEGAEVSFAEPGGPGGPGPPGPPPAAGRPGAPGARRLELAVVNGLDAGRRFPLGVGTVVVGRAAGCDIVLRDGTLSRRHAAITLGPGGDLTVDDLGSRNGTWLGADPVVAPVAAAAGAPLRLGALELEVRPVLDHDRPVALDPLRHTSAAGTIPLNRPPRPAAPAGPAEVAAPGPPAAGQARVPPSLVGILTPLLFAGAMLTTFREPRFLLFAGLSPVMAIANAVDGRRRGRRSERRERARFAAELRAFRETLAGLAAGERRRREAGTPDPAEIVRRASMPSTALWERRPGHDDFLRLRAGVGTVRWDPPVAGAAGTAGAGGVPGELAEVLAEAATLPGSPVPVDLSRGGVVGIVGDRPAALALARSLVCQAATLHGPADLPVLVLARPEAADRWDWAKWLPHIRDATGAGRRLAADPELSARLVEDRLKAARTGDRHGRPESGPGRPEAGRVPADAPTLLAVIDDESLTAGRRAPTRSLLRGEGGPVAGIVIASTVDRLPALCTTVVHMVDPDGGAELTLPRAGEGVERFLAAGMADDVARACARALARFEDPELDLVGAGLPASIGLLTLLGLEECTPDAVLARWRAAGTDPRPATPVGVSEDGVFAIDLGADGPHALVGGTTGSGKSELLRSLVAGLAASVDPDHLTFLLIDFKGGSAFDECAGLPHTVGVVTDLDEHLAERALRCLEAELRRRERTLRAHGATDLADHLRRGVPEPMPRLLVIIDEFATLRSELPRFVDALVDVAQRGRSLGVHLLLATQRPQGAISDNIRANTNLRIALRVQEANDSRDVIDVPDAAAIPRSAPGRAYVRLGPGEVIAIQSALSTGAHGASTAAPVDVAPFVFGPHPRPPAPIPAPTPAPSTAPPTAPAPVPPAPAPPPAGTGGGAVVPVTDLAVLVATISEAFARTGRPRPRRPWPDPLPGDIDLDALIDAALAGTAPTDPAAGGRPGGAGAAAAGAGAGPDPAAGTVPLAMADDPEAQAQYPVGWRPAEGNLIVYGSGGSGTTTALTGVVLALARLRPPDELHVYALDFGAGELGAIEPLPHVGAVVMAGERERQIRLVRHLRAELDRRRGLGAAAVRREPVIVTVVDGWSAFSAGYDDLANHAVWEAFVRVMSDGPEVGLCTVVAADRALAVPNAIASLVRQRLALRLADRSDYAALGVPPGAVPDMAPGRALVARTGQLVQIARPAGGAAAAARRVAARHPLPARPPVPIEPLVTEVRVAELGAAARLDARPWRVPVGVAERTRSAACLVAFPGEHALIVGPARSGRSTALLGIAAACRAARPDLAVVSVAGPRSPLPADPLAGEVMAPGAAGARLGPLVDGTTGPVLVLVDDAEAVDDAGGVLERLSTSDRRDLLLVAAGRNDGIRSGYGHWTRALRRSRLGVLLRPDIDLDGDVLAVKLPRRAPVGMVAGRGYLAVGGEVDLVQLALPR